MTGIATFSVAALDTRDPLGLARFYSALTGWPIRPGDEAPGTEWVELVPGGGATLAFQLAPGHTPPDWPGDAHPQQAHFDFDVPDLDEGETRVLAIGARKHEVQPGTDFRVYLDPAGHPFCLVLEH
ncbi:VOC family protein [Pseudonocardia halophobica]|uniref:Glyoxalase n=1 Tax=Pseudonocardia halophobica TaxID=29401 RepID=A0A9W6NYL5_9PSEU|nr:VOC family protein [Pseudonocardia halophobica]GLL14665.1 glyoxalase [Pseudonocardia halophobica]